MRERSGDMQVTRYTVDMTRKPDRPLRTGFTTGACATAATSAACGAMVSGVWSDPISIILPRGQRVSFDLVEKDRGEGWARATIIKDAGDDPDVTHGARISALIRKGLPGQGVRFLAGEGVGKVTRPGLPVPVGEPAINPVPRRMMEGAIREIAEACGMKADFDVEISVENGAELAKQTWNPRLGIVGGLSILGTTGIVRPFSCAAWIASIHRGVDVARAAGLEHVVGSTGATSESAARKHFGLQEHAMLDMGDFAGGMLKYLARHPVPRVTIAGGIGKLSKLAQGALDLHSSRSQVDFDALAQLAKNLGRDPEPVWSCNTASQALDIIGPDLAKAVAERAAIVARAQMKDAETVVDVLVFDRRGALIARSGQDAP